MKKKKGTNRATKFTDDLINALEKHRELKAKLHIREWKKNWRVPIGGHESRESVDVVGLTKAPRPVILIEAELLRQATGLNVLKIWQWATHDKRNKKLVFFIQGFTKPYYNGMAGHRVKAQFLAERMMKECPSIHYKQVRLDYTPRKRAKKGGGRRTHHAQNLAASVVRLCKSLG
jgi:hypothetical protein